MGIADSIDQLNDTLKELVHEIREWKQMMKQVAQET
jgi:prefoldin subunit 5